jgi:hypothetical protein
MGGWNPASGVRNAIAATYTRLLSYQDATFSDDLLMSMTSDLVKELTGTRYQLLPSRKLYDLQRILRIFDIDRPGLNLESPDIIDRSLHSIHAVAVTEVQDMLAHYGMDDVPGQSMMPVLPPEKLEHEVEKGKAINAGRQFFSDDRNKVVTIGAIHVVQSLNHQANHMALSNKVELDKVLDFIVQVAKDYAEKNCVFE